MTLVLAAHSRDTVWIVTDRCLYYGPGRANELGIKTMRLETVDGTGLLAYAGLGATASGMQPSEWMANVLRGRGELGFEESLGVLGAVAQRELPRHLTGPASGPHFIVAVGYLRSVGAVTYSIDNLEDDAFRLQRRTVTGNPSAPPTPLAMAGSGGLHLVSRFGEWKRPLEDVLKAHGRGRIEDIAVADHLAAINHSAYIAMQQTHGPLNTVGPRCIVLWAHRPEDMGGAGGGGTQFYSGRKRDSAFPGVPTIARGLDVLAIASAISSPVTRTAAGTLMFTIDEEERERRLAALPYGSDEQLH